MHDQQIEMTEIVDNSPDRYTPVPTPSVGRMVHFVYGGECLAATVTRVQSDDCINIEVHADGIHFMSAQLFISVRYDSQSALSTWHWPERV